MRRSGVRREALERERERELSSRGFPGVEMELDFESELSSREKLSVESELSSRGSLGVERKPERREGA